MKTKIEYFNMAMIPLYFGFTTDKKAFDQEMKRLEIKDPPLWVGETPACTHSLVNSKTGKFIVIVCLDRSRLSKNRNAVQALLVHEAVHVWQHALESMHAETPHGEFEAYTIQYISQLMFDKFNERKGG
jgi:hypothetical protein